MPTYEYVCESCAHEFERFQSISAEPVKVCPECGGPTRRLIGAGAGFIFKGSGFYVTDSRFRQASGQSQQSSNGNTGPRGDKSASSDSSDTKSGGAGNQAATEKPQATASQDSGKK